MTFVERYQQEETWHGKAIVMELFHLIMCTKDATWNISKTAESFGVSIGLVSENLRLAQAIHSIPSLTSVTTRQEALNKINRRGNERRA